MMAPLRVERGYRDRLSVASELPRPKAPKLLPELQTAHRFGAAIRRSGLRSAPAAVSPFAPLVPEGMAVAFWRKRDKNARCCAGSVGRGFNEGTTFTERSEGGTCSSSCRLARR